MPLEEGEGVSESQVSFYDIAGHNHDGANSTQIDFSAYNVLDIIDIGQLRDIIMGTVNNSTLSPNILQVGFAEGTIRIDGSAPSTVTSLTASSSASTTSDGNIFIDTSWVGSTNDSINIYVVELHKSETGINGTYVITRSHETTALSHRFERIDNNAGDGGNIYYKVVVYAISPVGVHSVPATSAGIAPAVNSTPPANTTFNDDYAAFDEGVKAAFKGMFVYLDDNAEFDVKELRGKYEYQVSVNKTSFDTSANLKASGKSKSTYFLVNNLDVRASAGGSKIDYYLRVRAINSSGTASTWVYYKNTADGGSSGAGTTTASAASAINVLEIDAGVDVQANTITANEIFAGTITATEIESATITGDELNSITINASRYIQSPDFVSGSAGWRIEGDGNAEFSEVTVRGVVYANTGRIGGTNGWTIASDIIQSIPSAANAVHLNSGGGGASSIPYLRMGAKTSHDNANAGVWLDPTNGLVLGSGTTGAWIKPDGKFYLGGASGALQWDGSNLLIDGGGTFTGALSAATGTFAGALSAATGTFAGTLSASVVMSGSIDIGGTDTTSWHVDNNGNMWWGNGGSYAAATVKISNTGDIDFTSGTFSGEVAAGTLSGAITSTATITGGAFATGSNAFTVGSDGAVTASNMTITGGSMTINNLFSVASDGDMWIGHATQGSAPFQVYNDGSVLCSDLQVTGGTISISSGKFAVDASGNLIAKSISLGDAAAPTSYSNSMVMGGSSLHKIRISSSAFGLYSNTTALEWYDSSLSTRRGYITGGQLAAVGANVDLGVQLGGDDNKQNYVVAYQESISGDGVRISAHKTSYNDICISAGGFIDLDAVEGIEISSKGSAPSSTSNKLYNHSGTLKWGTTSLTGGGGGAVDSIVAGTAVTVSSATGDVTVNVDLSALGTSTTNAHGDYFVVVDSASGPAYKLTRANIQLSGFSNNLGWTSNAGDITAVNVTSPITGGGSSGSVTIGFNESAIGGSGHSHSYAPVSHSHSYLALTGGTLSGGISFSNGNHITGSGSSNVYFQGGSGGTSWLRANSSGSAKIKCGVSGDIVMYASPRPNGNLYHDLGVSGASWNDVYLSAHVYNSDENLKKDIVDEVKGLDFINSLRPVTYKFKVAGQSDSGEDRAGVRTHHGFIAQEIATVLGVDADGDALWTNSTVPAQEAEDAVLDPDDSSIILEPAVEARDAFDQQGLRYEQFISVAVKGMQELSIKLDAAEARLAALEA